MKIPPQHRFSRTRAYSGSEHARGFTLIEMIVAITVFLFFLGFAFSSIQSIVKANGAANAAQKSYRDARHILDELAANIRSHAIDFECLDPRTTDIACAEPEVRDGRGKKILPLLSTDGRTRVIYKFENDVLLKFQTNRSSMEVPFPTPSLSDWKHVSAGNVPLRSLSFTIAPLKNPLAAEFALNDEIQIQPLVRIRLQTGALTLQTTYSTRIYGKHSIYE